MLVKPRPASLALGYSPLALAFELVPLIDGSTYLGMQAKALFVDTALWRGRRRLAGESLQAQYSASLYLSFLWILIILLGCGYVVMDVVDRCVLGTLIPPPSMRRHVPLSINPNSCLGVKSPYFCKVG